MITKKVSNKSDVDIEHQVMTSVSINFDNWSKVTSPLETSSSYSFRIFDKLGNTLLLVIYYY